MVVKKLGVNMKSNGYRRSRGVTGTSRKDKGWVDMAWISKNEKDTKLTIESKFYD